MISLCRKDFLEVKFALGAVLNTDQTRTVSNSAIIKVKILRPAVVGMLYV
jgi:hypothetical protein